MTFSATARLTSETHSGGIPFNVFDQIENRGVSWDTDTAVYGCGITIPDPVVTGAPDATLQLPNGTYSGWSVNLSFQAALSYDVDASLRIYSGDGEVVPLGRVDFVMPAGQTSLAMSWGSSFVMYDPGEFWSHGYAAAMVTGDFSELAYLATGTISISCAGWTSGRVAWGARGGWH